MDNKVLSMANQELVDELRLKIIDCCQDYKRKHGKGCKFCPYKKICDAHEELFWALDELENAK